MVNDVGSITQYISGAEWGGGISCVGLQPPSPYYHTPLLKIP